MANMPDKVLAMTYNVPLSHGDKVIGRATISVERVAAGSMSATYLRTMGSEVDVTVEITDNEFRNMLSRKLLTGLSISPEEE